MKRAERKKKFANSKLVTPMTLGAVIDATKNLAIAQWNPNGTTASVQDSKTKFADAVKTATGQK